MGRLAEALRANLKSVAESDARALREIDQELKAATSGVVPAEAQLIGQVDAKALLGKGSFKQQTVTTLKRLCKENGIKGFSKQIKRTPATLNLAKLPAGFAFQIELKLTDTTANKSKPIIESLQLDLN